MQISEYNYFQYDVEMFPTINQKLDHLFNRLQQRSRILHSSLLQEKEQYNRLMARFIEATAGDIYWRRKAQHWLHLTQRYRTLFYRKEEYVQNLDDKYLKLRKINQLLEEKQVLQQAQIAHYKALLHENDRRLTCVICIERPVNAIINPCHHGNFCKECVRRMRQNTCPLCRKEIESVQEYFL